MAGALDPPSGLSTAQDGLRAWLTYMDHERRSSPRTLRAYGDCVRPYLYFIETHRGEPLRFGLSCGVIGLEGPERTPAGWRALGPGTVDSVLGHEGQSRLGEPRLADVLFGEDADRIQSVALVRIVLWNPARQGVLAFGSSDPEGFTPDMGAELVAFLARVVERTAERWPVL